MRTRFLATDYFVPQSASETLADLHFLPLPPPDFSHSDLRFHLEIPFFDLDEDLRFDSDIDAFPIENALSEFLSDVVPRLRQVEEGDNETSTTPNQIVSPEEVVADLATVLDHKFSSYLFNFPGDKYMHWRYQGSRLEKELQFEIVEVEAPPINPVSSCEEGKGSFRLSFGVPNIDVPLDIIDIEVGITISYPHKVAKSICLVESIPSEHTEDQQHSCKDGSSSADAHLNFSINIPQFEVTSNSVELDVCTYSKEIFNFLLPIVEPWHGSQGQELVVDAKDFLGATAMDILTTLSGDAPSEHYHGDEMISLNTVLEMERDSTELPFSVMLQEVQIIDYPSDNVSEIFSNLETAKMDVSDQMLEIDTDFAGSLYESMVSSELALADDTFKSLPTPIISDDKAATLLTTTISNMLHSLKPHPLSACDGIYLDWHLLLEGTCNHEICSTYASMVEEVNRYNLTSELQIDFREMVATDIDFLDDSCESDSIINCEEVPTMLQIGGPQVHHQSAAAEIAQKQKHEIPSTKSTEKSGIINSEKFPFLFESMSQSNDLNFFLDVRKGSTRKVCENENSRRGKCSTQPAISLKGPSKGGVTSHKNPGQWNIMVHQIILSDDIRSLVGALHHSYLTILEESTYLSKVFPIEELRSISKQKMQELIVCEAEKQFNTGCKYKEAGELVTLFVIRQLAYFLCFFGLHIAHLYISNVSRSIEEVPSRLTAFESLIEDARLKSERQLIESHPSLSYIEKILRSNCLSDRKILVVGEKVFWLPLTRKLTEMKIKYHEVKNNRSTTSELGTSDSSWFTNFLLEELLHSDCLLISIDYISASIPFNKFSIILEYGGPNTSSRLSSLVSSLDVLPPVHFLHVKMDDQDIPAVFFEGYGVSAHPQSTSGMVSYSVQTLQANSSKKHLVDALNFVPTDCASSCISSESANQVDASRDNESAVSLPHIEKDKNMDLRRLSFPDVVIIVNTQNFGKKMLISRRSSYQKILALEKGGAQVVERDINLPLDLIFSAAVCLVWYVTRTFEDRTPTTTQESSMSMFMENIATNVLMSLSFSFSGCILIFEGESSFLASVMESSDALYAAAATLDVNLQLFCSYTPESTDEIILSCIRNVTGLNRGLYPPMPESETLGEAFLTRFPSINPLSAHVILSSGGSLVEFLEWSHERRIQAVGNYLLPDESISLFSALCRYGEIGESKSVMTESSSIGSDISSSLLQSPRKRKKFASHTVVMPIDDPLTEQANQLSSNGVELPQVLLTHEPRIFNNMQENLKKIEHGYQTIGRSHWNDKVGNQFLHEDFDDEMIHFKYTLKEKPFAMSNTSIFPWRPKSRTAVRSSVPTSRLAFSTYGHHILPTTSEINDGTHNWKSLRDEDQTWADKVFEDVARSSRKDDTHHPYLESNLMQDSLGPLGFSNQNKLPPSYRANSCVNKRPQLDSCWKFDFLHGPNETQETLKCNTCHTCPTSLRNKSTPSKSRSPSVIDNYRYQGGSQANKTSKQKKRKDIKGQSSPNNGKRKNPTFISPTWTPIDKRARQNLSFARYGNEKQSKLVWRNKNSSDTDCSSRKRYRVEAAETRKLKQPTFGLHARKGLFSSPNPAGRLSLPSAPETKPDRVFASEEQYRPAFSIPSMLFLFLLHLSIQPSSITWHLGL
ncbi:protein SHORTAGE IN CHIASMATA 1 [Ananas comosus]|uniref:Protein SHORTAGE IN CHIASMATA 1 n=1 Tax=Ananas comosus TaxID=4615 RepID=A0A6P5EUV6_ANACO|nr:protein SHORTAGE IN CHIASMATA 1 [Ananas comosus]